MDDYPITVLLVEDNLADVALLTELLQDADLEYWQITHAKRLSIALEYLQNTTFDVILLDLSLPDSQGLDTIVQVQSRVPHLPIIVLTGLQDKRIALQAVAQGAQDYLVKGEVSSELLLKTVGYARERIQILQRLQESEQRFRGIFNQTFQFMSLLSPDGVVLDINQALRDRMGFPDEAVLNYPIWEAPYWRFVEQSQSWLKMAILRASEGETLQAELQAYTSQETLQWLDFSIKPLRNGNNTITLLIAEGRNISTLKQAEAEIRQSLAKEQELNQMKNSFISMISHEFRTPLSSIILAVDLLENYNFEAEKKAQYYEQIRGSINRTLELFDEILLLGRTESGKVQAKYTSLDLTKFCSEIVETFQLTKGNSHQIIFSVTDASIVAKMDTCLLKHILENLLSNGLKYSPKGGIIRFSLSCSDHHAKFCIQDQGIGIPKLDQAKLFEPFHRAKNVGKIKGTGLGLAIVKRCVDLHLGNIQVDSKEGQGTTFTVILPRHIGEKERETINA